MSSKPKSNSTLRNLPEERQAQIAEWCAKPNDQDSAGNSIAKTGGLAWAQEQLAADGVRVSLDTLSRFYRSWLDEQTFQRANSRAQEVEQMLVKQFPDATPEKIAAAGQLVFTMEASNAGDAKTFIALEQLRLSQNIATSEGTIAREKLRIAEEKLAQKDRDHALAVEKFQRDSCKLFLKWFDSEQAKKIVTGSGSNAEKIEALGRAMFGEDWQS